MLSPQSKQLTSLENSAWLTEYKFFSAFPLFPFAMFGGILVVVPECSWYSHEMQIQVCLDKFAKPSPIDRVTCERISGMALEFTIVTAIVVTDQF